ncbi:MAG: PA14 domain-containing protein [Spirosomaceae bacterium]|jgi:hypothetical protein|nr:PA14 domain-containing protein [Spirosomataceae bacterium]
MKIKFLSQAACFLGTVGLFFSSHAQQMTAVTAGDFQKTGDWKTAQSVTMHPQKASFVKTTAGNDILLGSGGAKAVLLVGTGDLRLKMDFMLSAGASAALVLPTGHTLKLTDSWRASQLDASVCGSIEANAPLQNACKAPGLWQSIEIQMRRTASAQIEALKLNGNLVQESLVLGKATQPEGNVQLEIQSGTMAVTNVAYQLLRDERPVQLTNLSYELYKGWAEKPEQINPKNLLKKENTTILTQEWGQGEKNFYVIYEGMIDAVKAGEYSFDFRYKGHLWLDIDGKNVLPSGWSEFLQKPVVATLRLDQGKHPFRLVYHKTPWRSEALGVFVSAQGVRPYPLHVASSLPEPDPIPVLAVKPLGQAEMVRSFIQMEGEKTKRTHALSVGTPEGVHYSLDLNRGSLLQFWKGGFANTTDMWYERGEPQLLVPMSGAITTKGQSDFAMLADANAPWPDSSASISFKGYRLNKKGIPTVTYRVGNDDMTDEIAPENGSLTRTLTGTSGYVKAVTAQNITVVEKGLYAIDNHRFYLQIDPKIKPTIRTQNGSQELLLPLNGVVKYALIW